MNTILVTGSFDGLHMGHINFFEQAKALADKLVVIVARDKNIKIIKNREPTNNEQERLRVVQRVKLVDEAVLGHLHDQYKIVEEVNPDIFALGYDQTAFVDTLHDELIKRGCKARVVRLNAYEPEKHKSSKNNYQDNIPNHYLTK